MLRSSAQTEHSACFVRVGKVEQQARQSGQSADVDRKRPISFVKTMDGGPIDAGPPRPSLWDEHVVLLAASHLDDPESVLPLVPRCESDLYRALALGMLTGRSPQLPVHGQALHRQASLNPESRRDLAFWREACTTATELGLLGQVEQLCTVVDCIEVQGQKLRFRSGTGELTLTDVHRVLTATHVVFGAAHYGARQAAPVLTPELHARLLRLFVSWLEQLGTTRARRRANFAVRLEIVIAMRLLRPSENLDCLDRDDMPRRASREFFWHTDLLLRWLDFLSKREQERREQESVRCSSSSLGCSVPPASRAS